MAARSLRASGFGQQAPGEGGGSGRSRGARGQWERHCVPVHMLGVCHLEREPWVQLSVESHAGVLGPPFSGPAASLLWGLATLDHLKTAKRTKMLLSL